MVLFNRVIIETEILLGLIIDRWEEKLLEQKLKQNLHILTLLSHPGPDPQDAISIWRCREVSCSSTLSTSCQNPQLPVPAMVDFRQKLVGRAPAESVSSNMLINCSNSGLF